MHRKLVLLLTQPIVLYRRVRVDSVKLFQAAIEIHPEQGGGGSCCCLTFAVGD